MGNPKGFLKIKRRGSVYRPACERVKDYEPVFKLKSKDESQEQAERCMDCGTPFCHWACPVSNYIPEWNDLVFNDKWEGAYNLLNATNNLPEITGRVCPALCEYSCVLGINDDPITIRENELSIIEQAFKSGLVKPNPPQTRTGKKVAVIGSGPAGISVASQLNKYGHNVAVFEKDNKIGGIMRYGIPDFKLEKNIIDRRIDILKQEGIEFITGVNVGIDYPVSKLKSEFDAVCIAGGSRVPRDLKIEGRDLKGIYFAMDYLVQSNKRVSGEMAGAQNIVPVSEMIDAKGKKVVVIGGGDTGADCVGTAARQGAACVVQIELLIKPFDCRPVEQPWPKYPTILKTTTSHEEGGERHWAVSTKKFIGENGFVKKINCIKLDFSAKDEKGCSIMKEIPGSEFEIEADLVLLAMGFVHPEYNGLLKEIDVGAHHDAPLLDGRKNVKTDENYMTSVKGVFAAGDMRRGQSLIVWAIDEGRRAAEAINKYLS